MAGGNLSPRQKMINLMYLVLLAMLAMQVSVEVMEAFGKMYERSEHSIETGVEKNKSTLGNLKSMSDENPAQYKETYQTAVKVEAVSKTFIEKIGALKTVITDAYPLDEYGELPASNMAKGDVMDEYLFAGEGNRPAGDEFVAAVDEYRNNMKALVGGNGSVVTQLEASFNTEDQPVHDGPDKPWLDYTFKGIPAIGTMAILSSMENAVLNIENESLTAALSGRLKKATSATQLQAFVRLDKSTYSPGSEVKAEVFLASKDDSKEPNKVTINGKAIDLNKNFVGGKVLYNFRAGNVGDKPIVGEFIFKEGGEEVKVPISSNYSVVAASNQAIVSADKMNVVYRGLENPITITIPGISPNKVNGTAPGLSHKGGTAYLLKPQKGKEVSISVTGTADSGEKVVSPSVKFRIKDIPQAMASIRKQYGTIKMPKASLAKSTIEAGLPDFVFDLKLKVQSFKVKVPGKTTVTVNGGRMNAQAQKAIASAKRGDIVTVFGIRAAIIGNSSYRLKEVLPISVEISN